MGMHKATKEFASALNLPCYMASRPAHLNLSWLVRHGYMQSINFIKKVRPTEIAEMPGVRG